ncbi:MAG TPA: CDP-alcohol phosphatidyltransferase family protein [Burkholderiaceae bacterium]
MLDRTLTRWLRPALERGARLLHGRQVHADRVTWLGFALGMAAAFAIAGEAYTSGLTLLLASRLCDGLDGALARLTQPTDRGGFLDIALDFLFYASIPLAFAVASPAERALPAATLLAAFIGTGSSFLAFAVFAERRGLASDAHPGKGFFYLGGLTEASETLLCFALMCLWPQHFAWWAYGFALMCAMTIVTRLVAGWRAFGEQEDRPR